MTFSAPDPIPSGLPYDIVAVDGEAPSGLAQFEGETMLTISRSGSESKICGLGSTHGDVVRFQEKSATVGGKDVRTWEITQAAAGRFTAAATAAF